MVNKLLIDMHNDQIDIKTDNCIVFDDIADIYEETRPFVPGESKVFQKVSQILLEKFHDADEIYVLDAGTGIGRLAIKFAEAFQKQASAQNSNTKLKLHCVDKSKQMLKKFKEKLIWDEDVVEKSISENIFIKIEEKDIRDIAIENKKYDAIIAHWIFHTIFDWSTTLYSLTQLLNENGAFFTFEEDSDLYNAIDGDYNNIENEFVKKYWDIYFNLRNNTSQENYIPPRNRIGSRVKDKRIDTLLCSLGWSQKIDSGTDYIDEWSNKQTLYAITKNIIEKRAFTNMRFAQNNFSNEDFDNNLNDQLYVPNETEPENEKWEIKYSFKFKCYFFKDNREAKEYRTLLNIIKNTIGRKNQRKLDQVYNSDSFWKRLIDITWARINYSTEDKRKVIFGLVPEITIEQIFFAYAYLPNSVEKDTSDIRVYDKDKIHLSSIWSKLTNGLEVFDPVIISFNGFEFAVNHFSVFNHIIIESSELNNLKNKSNQIQRDRLSSLINHSKDFRNLLKNIENIGLLPFNKRRTMFKFFSGLLDIVKIENIKYCYLFPYYSQVDKKIYGLMLLCEKQLSHKAFDYINLLFDLVFNEYIDELTE